jgi:hypothetical protein
VVRIPGRLQAVIPPVYNLLAAARGQVMGSQYSFFSFIQCQAWFNLSVITKTAGVFHR